MRKYLLLLVGIALIHSCSSDSSTKSGDIEIIQSTDKAILTYLGRTEQLFVADYELELYLAEDDIREGLILRGYSDLVVDAEDFALPQGDYRLSEKKEKFALIKGEEGYGTTTGSYYYKKQGDKLIHKVLIDDNETVVTVKNTDNEYTVTATLSGVDLVSERKVASIDFQYKGTPAFVSKAEPIKYVEYPRCYLLYKGEEGNAGVGRTVVVLQGDIVMGDDEALYHGLQVETFITVPEDWYNVELDLGYYRISDEKKLQSLLPGVVSEDKRLSGTFEYESVVMQGTRNVVKADAGMIKVTKVGSDFIFKALMSGINHATGKRQDILSYFKGKPMVMNEVPAPPATWDITFTNAEAMEYYGAMELTLTREKGGMLSNMFIEFFMDENVDDRIISGKYVIDENEAPYTIYPGVFDEIYQMTDGTAYWEDEAGSPVYQYKNAVPATEGEMNVSVDGDKYTIVFEFKGINNDTKGEVTLKGKYEGSIDFK